MKESKVLSIIMISMALFWGITTHQIVVNASESNERIVSIQDNSIVILTPLDHEEVEELLKQAENQKSTRLDNAVSAMPVKVDSNRVAIDFTNTGFFLDFVDVVQTNLIIWHAADNNPVGYSMMAYKLPVGTHRTSSVYVANWHSAQSIGGYYMDGFGTEFGIGTASSIIYN